MRTLVFCFCLSFWTNIRLRFLSNYSYQIGEILTHSFFLVCHMVGLILFSFFSQILYQLSVNCLACCPRKNNSQHQTIIVEDPLIKLQLYRVNQSLSWKRAQHEFEGMKYTWLLMYKFAVFTVSEQICHSNSNFINKLSERDGILLTRKRKAI